jgi:hypothetical protein
MLWAWLVADLATLNKRQSALENGHSAIDPALLELWSDRSGGVQLVSRSATEKFSKERKSGSRAIRVKSLY